MKSGPLISVIVPVYNVEKYLSRCVDSIRNQIYQNLEIILVEDGSTDTSAKIAKEYAELDRRVQVVSHEENKGLFQARITGVTHATGKYIAFVDSDDYISIDWFYQLLKKAEATDADITVGEWCFDHEGGDKVYCNLDPFRIHDYELNGEEVLDAFMEQAGRSFSWTVVWNKLYRKTLWEKAIEQFKEFSTEHGHMLMWEDILFSSGIWIYAQRVVNVHNILYYYYKHSGASTARKAGSERNLKYIRDSSAAMHFMKTGLVRTGAWGRQEKNYNEWLKNAANIVHHDLVIFLGSREYASKIREAFEFDGKFESPDAFFYKTNTTVAPAFQWMEDIKTTIVSPDTDYVSFDIFDTLIQRPFLEPTDLFELLADKLNEVSSTYIDFKFIRESAERECRENVALHTPSKEEITLEEIYQYIENHYVIDPNLLNALKEKEIDLEYKLCYTRETGKSLYQLAQDAGKRVILCSDMYLPVELISKILEKNGYIGYYKLYLSSDLMLTKHTKNLFKFVLRDLGIQNAGSIIHIGDNWNSDVENPKSLGFQVGHLSKAADMFRSLNPGIYSGELYPQIFQNNNFKVDYQEGLKSFSDARKVLGIVSNKVFDNPYISFNRNSDFNCDPNMVGYMAMGPHLLGICNWLLTSCIRENVPTVHFVARDGYLLKKAFDLFNHSDTKSTYIRLSRRALILADVERIEDLYSITKKIAILHCSGEKLAEYLSPIIPEEKRGKLEEILSNHNIYYARNFKNLREFESCMKVFIEELVDMTMLANYKENLKSYFSSMIQPGDYIFDIGYSGRPEAALSNLLGYPVGSFYIHVNSEVAGKRQQRYDCPCYCFYDYKPCITGVIREHLMMELGPSAIAYEQKDGGIAPVFEAYMPSYESDMVTELIQQASLRFVQDFISFFGDLQEKFQMPKELFSSMYEYYLHYSKPFDREMFSHLTFEDKLGEGKEFSVLDFWNHEIQVKRLATESTWSSSVPTLATPVAALADLYADGLFVKLYVKLNKFAPKGSARREWMKKIASLFIK